MHQLNLSFSSLCWLSEKKRPQLNRTEGKRVALKSAWTTDCEDRRGEALSTPVKVRTCTVYGTCSLPFSLVNFALTHFFHGRSSLGGWRQRKVREWGEHNCEVWLIIRLECSKHFLEAQVHKWHRIFKLKICCPRFKHCFWENMSKGQKDEISVWMMKIVMCKRLTAV